MWYWKRMCKIRWNDDVRNKELLRRRRTRISYK